MCSAAKTDRARLGPCRSAPSSPYLGRAKRLSASRAGLPLRRAPHLRHGARPMAQCGPHSPRAAVQAHASAGRDAAATQRARLQCGGASRRGSPLASGWAHNPASPLPTPWPTRALATAGAATARTARSAPTRARAPHTWRPGRAAGHPRAASPPQTPAHARVPPKRSTAGLRKRFRFPWATSSLEVSPHPKRPPRLPPALR